MTAGICGAVFAFIPSPFGLPAVMIWILADTDIPVSAALFRDGGVAAILKEIMSRYDL
ncbi:MAG: CD1845 family protein [Synergistaceae bacterium]|nr:CD1845 family protein [Synergistaceae bacterium]